MAGNADPIQKQASREATDWLILLQDDPEDEDLRQRFEAWLVRSPINAEAWEITRRTAAAIDGASPSHAGRWQPFLDQARAGTPTVSPIRPEAPRVGRRQAMWLGGLSAAASVLVLLFGPDLVLSLRADHVTGAAEMRTVRLEDGSVVTLAPRSAISTSYGAGERRIGLLAGGAFFEVLPDAHRPFQVSAGGLTATVLGTAFEIRNGGDATAVEVEHGVVRVAYSAAGEPATRTLTAGQSLSVPETGPAERSTHPAGQIAAWRRNQLIAQDQPLGEVVDRLRPYYAGTIIVTDGALAGQSVTGVFNLGNPEQALRAIARAHNAVVRPLTPWILLVSAS